MNANQNESLRLFFALWPDDATRTALMQLQAPLHGRIIPYGNLHLTLAFLGRQPAALLPDLKEILMHCTSETAILTLDQLGYFTRNRIVWAGTHQAPDALLLLVQELTQALASHGIGLNEPHNFKPHITLARDASPPSDMVFDPIIWRADRVALVQSTTSAEGSIYQVLASRSLAERCWLPDENGDMDVGCVT